MSNKQQMLIDITGQKFGRWTVIGRAGKDGKGRATWHCVCDCGEERVCCGTPLRNGTTRSCGCLFRQLSSERKLSDLTGRQFGRWRVLARAVNQGRNTMWDCVCACGTQRSVMARSLVWGVSLSCGCWNKEVHTYHGHGRDSHTHKPSPTFRSWDAMIVRCSNPNATGWEYYGGANPPVMVCSRWLKFENFLADMGPKPEPKSAYSLGRFGDIGNYEPSNVKWMTDAEQKFEAKIKRLNKQLQYLHTLTANAA